MSAGSTTKLFPCDNLVGAVSQHISPLSPLIVTTKGTLIRGHIDELLAMPEWRNGMVFSEVTPNPSVRDLAPILEKCQRQDVDCVLAVGGGSVIDTAKVVHRAIAEKTFDIQQLAAKAHATTDKDVASIMVPTTSGTGAEVTPFATVWDNGNNKKLSIDVPFPDLAILTPEITRSLNYQDTLFPALDALSHAIESLWNVSRNETSQALALEAIELALNSLPIALSHPDDLEARADLQMAASKAGQAISITKTALAHAISYPFTLRFGVPHGLACSFTLPAILEKLDSHELKLSAELVDKISEYLGTLNLKEQMANFLDADALENMLEDFLLDPSRAKNFIHAVSQNDINNIIRQSLG